MASSSFALILALPLLAPPLTAQSGPSALERSLGTFSLGSAELDVVAWNFGPRLSLAEVALPVLDRRDLDRTAEVAPDALGATWTATGFDALPGGIVLGRAAVPTEDPGPCELVVDGGGVALATVAGARCYLTEQRPQVLAACIDFVLRVDGSDVLIDIRSDMDGSELVRVAAELDVGPLRSLLRRADSMPGTLLPRVLNRKTMILDEATHFALVGERLEAWTSLEVRVLAPRNRGLELRASQVETSYLVPADSSGTERASGPSVAPLPAALARELRPLQELAGLLAFLRWAEARDPGALTALRGQLGVPPRPSPLSLAR